MACLSKNSFLWSWNALPEKSLRDPETGNGYEETRQFLSGHSGEARDESLHYYL